LFLPRPVDVEGLNKTAYMEDMKEWRKEKARIKRSLPKLYALTIQYLRDEHLEAIQKQQYLEKQNDV
jgi:hypothetical protein